MICDHDWLSANIGLRLRTAAKVIIPAGLANVIRRALSPSTEKPPLERWTAALPSEVNFWRGIIYGTFPNREWVAEMQQRVRGEYPFPDHLRRYLKGRPVARILDVGAGPVTLLGGAPNGVEVVAVDPLAEDYNRLLDKQGLGPLRSDTAGDGERLSELGLGLFDLVYSRNALDHAYDPVRAIREMTKLCRPDGVVYFEGAVNESVREHGVGLHQWNFLPIDNGDLVVWQMDKKAVSLRCALGEEVRVEASGNDYYKVEIRHQI